MSIFKLGFPSIQKEATATSNLTAATDKPLTNLFSGTRSDRYEANAETSDIQTINYDLGASVTKTANFLAIMRAKLLAGGRCSGVRLRGSSVSGVTLPITPTAFWTADRGVTTASGAISQLNDSSGNGNTASQGSASSRPILSGASQEENRVIQSNALNLFTQNLITSTTATTDPDGGNTAWKVLANGTIGAHYINSSNFNIVNGQTYSFKVFFRPNVGATTQILLYGTGVNSSFNINSTTGAVNASLASTGLPRSNYQAVAADGGFYISFDCTASVSAVDTKIALYVNNSAYSSSYAGAGENVDFYHPEFKISTASSTYIPTTTFPIFAGINGNRVPVFDGSNDSLTTSLAVNPTGGMWGIVVVRANTTALGAWLAADVAGTTKRLQFIQDTGGVVYARIFNNTAVYVGRSAPAGTVVANQTAVFSFTYDGGTSSSGVKIYKNGVQVDNANSQAGSFVVSGAGKTLDIGGYGAVNAINGYLLPAAFGQGSVISDVDRQAIEAYLISKYITAPLVQIDNLADATFTGSNAEDYWLEFTESAAYRHYWLELVNENTTTNYKASKIFFGKALDLGREPVYPINISRTKDNPWSRSAAYKADLNFEAISDTKKSELMEVIKEPELAVVALDQSDLLFRGALGMHCSIVDNNIDPFYATENDLSITLKENI